jgi:hypothetical protein
MLALPISEDLSLFVPYSLFIASFMKAKRISFSDTPATASFKERLLIALHNSLLIGLLDLWEQNILVLVEDWVGRLLELQISHHWRFGKKYLMFPVLKFHCQLHHYVYREIRPIHGIRIIDLGICVCVFVCHREIWSCFINGFTEASIVAALLKAGPNNLHTTKGVATRLGLLPGHVSVYCAYCFSDFLKPTSSGCILCLECGVRLTVATLC